MMGRLRVSLVLALLCCGLPLLADVKAKDEVDTCLSCHGEKSLAKELPSGEVRSLTVDRAAFEKSVHGAKLGCTGCHPGYQEMPHPERPAKDLAAFTASFRETCRSCHFANYTKAIDSVHFAALSNGNTSAPFCADCHGAHDVTKPNEPRTKISETCGTCHAVEAEQYAQSVHGKALAATNNPDVPVCIDCHKSHAIADPRTQAWRLKSPETCGGCHTDKTRMARYGLSAGVYSSYLDDFHGRSASLYAEQSNKQRKVVAVCVDCHGVHDIARVNGAGSGVLKRNLQAICAKCHPGAPPNFPAAWLSHYAPSPKSAPLVWATALFYKILIPVMIGGLALQVLLHLWRVVVNR
jgi:nitrate/TMAO reductase-like tetraheme cytochrome c subunit